MEESGPYPVSTLARQRRRHAPFLAWPGGVRLNPSPFRLLSRPCRAGGVGLLPFFRGSRTRFSQFSMGRTFTRDRLPPYFLRPLVMPSPTRLFGSLADGAPAHLVVALPYYFRVRGGQALWL